MSGSNLVKWFREVWLSPEKRFRVLGEYRALARSPYLLADIALRGGVMRPAHEHGNTCCDTAFNDGKRALAQEILELARTDPQTLMDFIEHKPKPGEK